MIIHFNEADLTSTDSLSKSLVEHFGKDIIKTSLSVKTKKSMLKALNSPKVTLKDLCAPEKFVQYEVQGDERCSSHIKVLMCDDIKELEKSIKTPLQFLNLLNALFGGSRFLDYDVFDYANKNICLMNSAYFYDIDRISKIYNKEIADIELVENQYIKNLLEFSKNIIDSLTTELYVTSGNNVFLVKLKDKENNSSNENILKKYIQNNVSIQSGGIQHLIAYEANRRNVDIIIVKKPKNMHSFINEYYKKMFKSKLNGYKLYPSKDIMFKKLSHTKRRTVFSIDEAIKDLINNNYTPLRQELARHISSYKQWVINALKNGENLSPVLKYVFDNVHNIESKNNKDNPFNDVLNNNLPIFNDVFNIGLIQYINETKLSNYLPELIEMVGNDSSFETYVPLYVLDDNKIFRMDSFANNKYTKGIDKKKIDELTLSSLEWCILLSSNDLIRTAEIDNSFLPVEYKQNVYAIFNGENNEN